MITPTQLAACRIAMGLEPLSDAEIDCLGGHVESARTRTLYTCGDDEDALHFSAFLLHQIAKLKQCLVDGNKRMAWFAMLKGLSTWELSVDCTDDEAEELVLGVANGTVDPDAVLTWLQEHLVELPDDAYAL